MFTTAVLAAAFCAKKKKKLYAQMHDFAKFQPHQIADDKIVIFFVPQFCICFMLFFGSLRLCFEFFFKLQIFSLDLPGSVGM